MSMPNEDVCPCCGHRKTGSAVTFAASDGSAKMYVIQWTDAWGRIKERTVWAESRLAALRQVYRSTARIISPNDPDQRPGESPKTL